MGEMPVPADALYGASTARAVANFPIANRPLPPAVIHAFGHLKAACAQANKDLGKLDARLADAIIAAADEVAHGKHDAHFPVDVYQTGSGTSTNMNANEVIASIANDKLGLGATTKADGGVHPNDHVNMGQSSNDTFPTAMGIATAIQVEQQLLVALNKIANDIRHLGSGPRCGIGELNLPAIQPGSSIMPGKVNPVICESVMQVCCRVIGNDATVTTAGLGGVGSIFELNVAMPVMIDAFLESVTLLSNVCNVFVDKLLDGLEVNEARCTELLEASLMTITALAPEIGYDKCSALAKQAHQEGKTIKQLVGELELMPPERLAELMDYDAMTRPG
eukprot:g13397.t1